MKKKFICFLFAIFVLGESFAQNKISVAAGSRPDCLLTYNVAYQTYDERLSTDLAMCAFNAMVGITDPTSPVFAGKCVYDAYARFDEDCDLAANMFAACSGLEITN